MFIGYILSNLSKFQKNNKENKVRNLIVISFTKVKKNVYRGYLLIFKDKLICRQLQIL